MTNKQDECGDQCDAHAASMIAAHLIDQILEEASLIVNAAKDSGDTRIYLSNFMKNIREFQLDDSYNNELTFVVSNHDKEYFYENRETTVFTSTPQKLETKITKSKNDIGFVGQGDEVFKVTGYELRKSTSMFINNLFDMSDVEHLITVKDDVVTNRNTRSEELLIENKNVSKQEQVLQQNNNESSKSAEYSSYSPLSDAFCDDISKNFCRVTYDGKSDENKIYCDIESTKLGMSEECVLNETIQEMVNNDLAVYENAYLTMNRDYEQYSDEENPVLLDPKTASLQEIELVTDKISKGDLKRHQDSKTLNAISGVSTSGTSSKKSNIVRRCRHHGAKLLSCLKGWLWRRKLHDKRENSLVYGSIRGLCPLSPDARRRAASLRDQRNLRTPSPSTSIRWKFNTVNEALVHSSRWKEFGLKMSLNENDEF